MNEKGITNEELKLSTVSGREMYWANTPEDYAWYYTTMGTEEWATKMCALRQEHGDAAEAWIKARTAEWREDVAMAIGATLPEKASGTSGTRKGLADFPQVDTSGYLDLTGPVAKLPEARGSKKPRKGLADFPPVDTDGYLDLTENFAGFKPEK